MLVAAGGPVVALAAKAATETVPIVFTAVTDPVKSGLVVSLNRPGGNATGTAGLTTELDAKRLELLREMVPSADVVGVLRTGQVSKLKRGTLRLPRKPSASDV